MEKDKVSLILPIYNIGKLFLDNCIKSLELQTYKNIEIILVNDGSTNNIESLLNDYQQTDARIRVLKQENSGVSVARNNGLAVATGEYICFIDPDDWVATDYVEKLLRGLKESDADFVISDCYVVEGRKTKINRFLNIKESNLIHGDKNLLLYQLVGKKICTYYPPEIAAGVPWGKMFKKEFILKRKLRFIPELKRMQDNVFCLYAIEYATKIHYLPETIYYYRKDQNSVSVKYSTDIINSFEKYFDETFKFLKKFKKEDIMFQAFYAKELTSFNSFFSRFFFNKKNPTSWRKTKYEINQLLAQNRYQEAFKNTSYSILMTQEKIFIFFLRRRCYWILKLLIKIKNRC